MTFVATLDGITLYTDPLTQVLVALRFYTSGSFLQVVGDTVGVDKSTISRVVAKVSRALVAYINCMLPRVPAASCCLKKFEASK